MKINNFLQSKWPFVFFAVNILIQIIFVLIIGTAQNAYDNDPYSPFFNYHINNADYFYPNIHDLYSLAVVAPGLINIMIWLLTLGVPIMGIYFLNICMSMIIGLLIYKICTTIASKEIAGLSLILFSLYPHWMVSANVIKTEIPFVFFFILSIYLTLKNKPVYLILAGSCLFYANWIRPFLPVLCLILIATMIYASRKHIFKRISILISSIIVPIIIVGTLTYYKTGYFAYQSTTQAFNILLSANDEATGTGQFTHMRKKGGALYIENSKEMICFEKEKIWMDRAHHWIKKNPLRWLALRPKIVLLMYYTDSFFFTRQHNSGYTKQIAKDFPKLNGWQILSVINLMIYYIILIGALIGTYLGIKKAHWGMIIVSSYIILGTAATSLTVGINRYHFVFIPYMIILASFFYVELYNRLCKKQQ